MRWSRLLLGLLIVAPTQWMAGQIGPAEWLPEWGQAGWSNPALLHPSGGHLLLGALSGAQLQAHHTGPTYFDFIGGDGAVDPSLLLERMDAVETLGFRSEVPLISVGFKEDERVEFRLRSRLVAEQQLTYDRDFFDVAWRGNGHPDNLGRTLDFSGFGTHAQAYFDHGLSVGAMAKEDRLWLGWGIHVLNGIGAFQTDQFEATWITDTLDYSWDIEGAATISSAGLDLDSLLGGGELWSSDSGRIPPTVGAGVAFDYGFLYRITPKVSLEGSIEGRGGLRWLESVSRKQVNSGAFVIEGLDLVSEWRANDALPIDSIPAVLEEWLEGLADSLEQTFPVNSAPGLAAAFDTRIQETWRLGLRIRPLDELEISAVVYRQFRFGTSMDGGLLGLTYRLGSHLTVHGQCQYYNARWLWGGGLSVRGGPVRWSISARNIPAVFWPLDDGNWHFQTGFSFDFGYLAERTKRRKNDLGDGKGMWH